VTVCEAISWPADEKLYMAEIICISSRSICISLFTKLWSI